MVSPLRAKYARRAERVERRLLREHIDTHSVQLVAGRTTRLGVPRALAPWLAVLLLVGAVANVAWMSGGRLPQITNDSDGYLEVAQDLSDASLDERHDRPIGYPTILLLTGSQNVPNKGLFAAQVVMHLVAIWLLCALLCLLVPARPAVVLGFAALALAPPVFESTGYVLTETPALLLISVAAYLCGRYFNEGRARYIAAASGVLGLAALVRPAYQLAFVVIPATLFAARILVRHGVLPSAPRSSITTVIAAILPALAIVGSISAYNRAKFDFVGVSPLLPWNLATRTAPMVESLPAEDAAARRVLIQARDAELVKPGSSHTGEMYIWSARHRLAQVTGKSGGELERYMLELDLKMIRGAPLTYLDQVARSAGSYWTPSAGDLANRDSKGVQLLWAALHAVVLTIGFAVVGMALAFIFGALIVPSLRFTAHRIPTPAILALILCSMLAVYNFFVSTFLEVGNPRYRRPVELAMLLAAGLAFELIRLLRNSDAPTSALITAGPLNPIPHR